VITLREKKILDLIEREEILMDPEITRNPAKDAITMRIVHVEEEVDVEDADVDSTITELDPKMDMILLKVLPLNPNLTNALQDVHVKTN